MLSMDNIGFMLNMQFAYQEIRNLVSDRIPSAVRPQYLLTGKHELKCKQADEQSRREFRVKLGREEKERLMVIIVFLVMLAISVFVIM